MFRSALYVSVVWLYMAFEFSGWMHLEAGAVLGWPSVGNWSGGNRSSVSTGNIWMLFFCLNPPDFGLNEAKLDTVFAFLTEMQPFVQWNLQSPKMFLMIYQWKYALVEGQTLENVNVLLQFSVGSVSSYICVPLELKSRTNIPELRVFLSHMREKSLFCDLINAWGRWTF